MAPLNERAYVVQCALWNPENALEGLLLANKKVACLQFPKVKLGQLDLTSFTHDPCFGDRLIFLYTFDSS